MTTEGRARGHAASHAWTGEEIRARRALNATRAIKQQEHLYNLAFEAEDQRTQVAAIAKWHEITGQQAAIKQDVVHSVGVRRIAEPVARLEGERE
jgi:hypothetical protein